MAGPTDPIDPTDTGAIEARTAAFDADTAAQQRNVEAGRAVAEVTANVQRQMASVTGVLGNVSNVLNGFTSSYVNAANNLKGGLFTDDNARNVGLFTTAMLGATNSVGQFSGLSIDRNVLLGPIEDMKTALSAGGGALDKMAENVLSVFGKVMPDSAKDGAEAIVTFGMKFLQSADNAVHMRDAMLTLGAASGNLNRIFTASGPELENLNEIMGQQSEQISGVAHTMNISRADAVKYYSEIGKIPGALTATIPASDQLFKRMDNSVANSGGTVDMFTGAIALAKGTGRDFGDVVKDLNTAFKDYSLTGKDALNFSVNMSEISNNLGIDLQSVQSTLSNTVQTFRTFANTGAGAAAMTDGLARLTNNYAQALQNQGLSGNVALEVAQNMTNELSKMGIAQKALISAQTGGPGGLMGAFQIEKDLREGKIENVFKKVRDVMQKQLGSIVTLEDATKSPAAAAQLARQVTMLRSGPLGQFARTDQEAFRVLEAFKAGTTGIKELAPDALKGAMDRGVILQDQSRTLLSEIRADAERQLALTEQTNLLLAQQLTAATGGRREADSAEQAKYRNFLKMESGNAAERSAVMAERTGTAVGVGRRAGPGVDLGVSTTAEGMTQNTADVYNELMSAKNQIVGIVQNKAKQEFNNVVDKLKTETNPEIISDLRKKAVNLMQASGATGQGALMNERTEELTTSGRTLGGTVATAINNPAATPLLRASAPAETAIMPRPVSSTVGGDINVHVTGYCVKCKQEIEGGHQLATLSPPTKNTAP